MNNEKKWWEKDFRIDVSMITHSNVETETRIVNLIADFLVEKVALIEANARLQAIEDCREVVEGMKEKETDCQHTPSDSCDMSCVYQHDIVRHNLILSDISTALSALKK